MWSGRCGRESEVEMAGVSGLTEVVLAGVLLAGGVEGLLVGRVALLPRHGVPRVS